jgi:type IV pilus assembly protein PilA
MRQMLKNKLKEQKGLTLIELLAVIVILGIIAAIAVPSIMGIMDNSKKDAHIANARQMISSTKMATAEDKTLIPPTGKGKVIPLSYLEHKGYLETLKDPDGDTTTYVRLAAAGTSVAATVDNLAAAPVTDSYVIIINNAGKLEYHVRLVSADANGKRGVQAASTKLPIAESALSRDTSIN